MLSSKKSDCLKTNLYLIRCQIRWTLFKNFNIFWIFQVPEETCNLTPKKQCKHVTRLVPNLKPVEDCIDVSCYSCNKITKTWIWIFPPKLKWFFSQILKSYSNKRIFSWHSGFDGHRFLQVMSHFRGFEPQLRRFFFWNLILNGLFSSLLIH